MYEEIIKRQIETYKEVLSFSTIELKGHATEFVVNAIFQEVNKDLRVQSMKLEKSKLTERQRLFLEKLGYTGNFELTKEEASKIIDKLVTENKES